MSDLIVVRRKVCVSIVAISLLHNDNKMPSHDTHDEDTSSCGFLRSPKKSKKIENKIHTHSLCLYDGG